VARLHLFPPPLNFLSLPIRSRRSFGEAGPPSLRYLSLPINSRMSFGEASPAGDISSLMNYKL